MPISEYYRQLRDLIGTRLLLMPAVAAVIRNDRGEILLQKTAHDHRWSLPAGAVEPGERPQQSVVREVYEETGLQVEVVSILAVEGGKDFRYTYPHGDEVEATVIFFECRVIDGELAMIDGESIALSYFDPENLPELVLPYPGAIFRMPGSQEGGFTSLLHQ